MANYLTTSMKTLLLVVLLGLFGISGCGQKGALYIPGSEEQEAAITDPNAAEVIESEGVDEDETSVPDETDTDAATN